MPAIYLRSKTVRETFSFYVAGGNSERIRAYAEHADAVVIAGANGPSAVRQLRDTGWDGTVIFDGNAYKMQEGAMDPNKWFLEQRTAGADRLLTPGLWVDSASTSTTFEHQIEEEVNLARSFNATCLLAIDRRWFTKTSKLNEMTFTLEGLDVPVAIVLGDKGDPMAYSGAVDGLVSSIKSIDKISILRCDQVGIGALAYGAAHASFGLTSSHRHVVPPGVSSFAKVNDRSARVFVRQLLDWFTASTIAGWSTTDVPLSCQATCCRGQAISRFLDDRLKSEADLHNLTVLAGLAEEILCAPLEDGVRRQEFARICREAVSHYGTMGHWRTEITPKRQLTQWALYC